MMTPVSEWTPRIFPRGCFSPTRSGRSGSTASWSSCGPTSTSTSAPRSSPRWVASTGKYFYSWLKIFTVPQVEPAVESALSGFKLSGFKFDRERVFLGQVPPRVTGIKVSGGHYWDLTSSSLLNLIISRCTRPMSAGKKSFWMLIWCLPATWKLCSKLKVKHEWKFIHFI